MTTKISHVQLQYSHTIGRGEQFGPGFSYPMNVARGEGDLMYVLCRSSEYRPEGTRVAVCTTDEEYVTAFARGVAGVVGGAEVVVVAYGAQGRKVHLARTGAG